MVFVQKKQRNGVAWNAIIQRSGRLGATLFYSCTNGLNVIVPGGSPKGATTITLGATTVVM